MKRVLAQLSGPALGRSTCASRSERRTSTVVVAKPDAIGVIRNTSTEWGNATDRVRTMRPIALVVCGMLLLEMYRSMVLPVIRASSITMPSGSRTGARALTRSSVTIGLFAQPSLRS